MSMAHKRSRDEAALSSCQSSSSEESWSEHESDDDDYGNDTEESDSELDKMLLVQNMTPTPRVRERWRRESTGCLTEDLFWENRWSNFLRNNCFEKKSDGKSTWKEPKPMVDMQWWHDEHERSEKILGTVDVIWRLETRVTPVDHKGNAIPVTDLSVGIVSKVDIDLSPEGRSSQCFTNNSPLPFVYAPLKDSTKQIRLMRIKSGQSHHTIELELSTWYLDRAPPFNAISYTWGAPSSRSCGVLVDGTKMLVRPNCHYALCQTRLHYPENYVWIDSICINQFSIQERNHQVRFMFSIYTRAMRVLSCLGPHEDGSEFFADVVQDADVDGPPPFANELELASPEVQAAWDVWLETRKLMNFAPYSKAFRAFTQRSYWWRVWILPEIASGNPISFRAMRILCGGHNLSAFSFRAVTAVMERGMSGWSNHVLRPFAIARQKHDLVWVLRNFKSYECADPRDRLYAMLPFITWRGHDAIAPVPDYSKPAHDLVMHLYATGLLNFYELKTALEAFRLDHQDASIQVLTRARVNGEMSSSAHGSFKCVETFGFNFEGGDLCLMLRCHADGQYYISTQGVFTEQEYTDEALKTALQEAVPDGMVVVYNDAGIVACICPDARAGDILVPVNDEPSGKLLLVLRHTHEQVFDVVGQGFFVGSSRGDLTYVQPIIDISGPNDLAFKAKVELQMCAEDVLIWMAQDFNPETSESYDVMTRLDRPFIPPLASPKGAARITGIPDEAVDIINEEYDLDIVYSEWKSSCPACGENFVEEGLVEVHRQRICPEAEQSCDKCRQRYPYKDRFRHWTVDCPGRLNMPHCKNVDNIYFRPMGTDANGNKLLGPVFIF